MAKKPVKVKITYCAECGYEPQTLALTEALMTRFAHDRSSIGRIPGYEGSSEVSVEGGLVHQMYRDGGSPEHGKGSGAVRARLAAE